MEKKEMTYSEAVQEIEDIISKIENDNLDMDKLSKSTSRALELIKWCKLKLKNTENDIDKLLEDMNE